MYTVTCILLISLSCIVVTIASPAATHVGIIIGGEDIPIEKAPYQVAFEINGALECGGSIIAPNYITPFSLPASSRLQEDDKLTVRAGTSTRESGGQVIAVKKYTQHPDYNFDNDIAIIELAENLEYNEKIVPIKLPSRNQRWPGETEALVSGWGVVWNPEPSHPVNLQGLVLKLVDEDVCIEKYTGTESFVCAAVDGGGKTPCYGDSGGPLQVDGTLVGVVSGGACGSTAYPGYFANVAALRDFITDVTGL